MPAPQERGELPLPTGEVQQAQLSYSRERTRIGVDFVLACENESSSICLSTGRGCASKGECASSGRCD